MTVQFHLYNATFEVVPIVRDNETARGPATVITLIEHRNSGQLTLVVSPSCALAALEVAAILRAAALEHGAREDAMESA